ncbi:uncharacterized protein LOC129791376 [Lutzomyia longipalpis]|uniref:uncharacterized protein LOC129791376 n=1 Tax=Lutzomyia longipalpis TaxID=7200 RepID=UPI002483DE30|nr:uncharacterized protein LOC129791376 [Lutzomyia longipalpis]
MALNIALPLSVVGEFMDSLDILSSPEEPPAKLLISPISSESSGISSMGSSDEIKKSPEKQQTTTYQDCKIMYGGRNIIDMGSNLTNGSLKIRFTELPENNFPMFLSNRSQYHRLGAHGHIQEYTLIRCSCCGLMIPDQPELVPIPGPNSICRAIIAAQMKLLGTQTTNTNLNNDARIYSNTNNSNSCGLATTTNGHINNAGVVVQNALMYRQSYTQNSNAHFKYYSNNNNCQAIM